MNFELLLTLSILILFGLFFGWIYSEVKLEGKFNKTINWISFPFPLLALYSIFKLNLDFGYVLVGGENKYEGYGHELLNDQDVRKSFLGG